MCRFVVFWGQKPVRLAHWLIEAENSLLSQSKSDCSNRPNPDGWGLAFRKGEKIVVEKNIVPAFEDNQFVEESRKLKTDLLFAHIRRRSQGPVLIENTHPFVHKNWMFMHNGNIPHLPRLKVQMSKSLPEKDAIQTHGTTDSEFLFRYFHYWFQRGNQCDVYCALNIINDIIRRIIEYTPPQDQKMLALNFMVTNGEYLLGFRRNRSLYYAHLENGVMVSSERLDQQCQWNEIPDNHYVVGAKPGQIKLVAYDIELKKPDIFAAEKMV